MKFTLNLSDFEVVEDVRLKEGAWKGCKRRGGNQRHGRWAAPCSMELTGRGGRRIKFRWNFQKSRQLWSFFSLRSRRNKKDQDGPRRTLVLKKAQDGPRRTLILKKAQDGPRRALILKIVGRCPWLKGVGQLFSTYSRWKIIPKFPGVATTE